jgi:hypothetical protein
VKEVKEPATYFVFSMLTILLLAFGWWWLTTTESASILMGTIYLVFQIVAWSLLIREVKQWRFGASAFPTFSGWWHWVTVHGRWNMKTVIWILATLLFAGVMTGHIAWCHGRYYSNVCLK